jgi:hypothetical protein
MRASVVSFVVLAAHVWRRRYVWRARSTGRCAGGIRATSVQLAGEVFRAPAPRSVLEETTALQGKAALTPPDCARYMLSAWAA